MSKAGPASGRPRIRLVWDEQLSPRVADALRVLGFDITRPGMDERDVPARGAEDAIVIEYAQRDRRVIVTSNHDMMTLCHEADQRFVWIDPYGRQLRREDQVLLAFQQISRWAQMLHEHPDRCVRALRSKCMLIESAEAARLARQRMRSLERKRRTRTPSPRPMPGEVRLSESDH